MSPETKKAVVGALVVLAIIGAVVLVVYFVSAKTSHKGKPAAAPRASAAPRLAGGSAIERDSINVQKKMNALVARSAGTRKAGAVPVQHFKTLGTHSYKRPKNESTGLSKLIEQLDSKCTTSAPVQHTGVGTATRMLIDKGNASQFKTTLVR